MNRRSICTGLLYRVLVPQCLGPLSTLCLALFVFLVNPQRAEAICDRGDGNVEPGSCSIQQNLVAGPGTVSPGATLNVGAVTAYTISDTGSLLTNQGRITNNNANATTYTVLLNTSSAAVTNLGTIFAFGTASTGGAIATGDGVSVGSITNASTGDIGGTISLNGINGNLTNGGTITSLGTAVAVGTVGGAVSNSGTITGAGYGVSIGNVGGAVSNGGTISGAAGAGLLIAGNVGGAVSNSGSISGTGGDGLEVLGTVGGAVSNSGAISGTAGVVLGNITGSFANSGTISGTNGVAAILMGTIQGGVVQNGTVQGIYANSGTIGNNAGTGVVVAGASPGVTLNLTNTGTITGSNGTALDYSLATGASTITQAGGSINGSILLSTFGDTVHVIGGNIVGNIVGNSAVNGSNAGTVNFDVGSGNTVTTGGTIDVANIAISSGTLLLANDVTVFNAVTNNATLQLLQTGGARTITGNYQQGSSGTLALEVSPTGSAQLVVTKSAAISGKLALVYDSGTYTPKTYTLIRGGALSGTFSQITGMVPTAGLTQTISVNPTDVLLSLTSPPQSPTSPPPSPSSIATAGATYSSARATVQASNTILSNYLGSISRDIAFSMRQPQQEGGSSHWTLSGVSAGSEDLKWGVWGDGSGGWLKNSSATAASEGYDTVALAGIDYRITNNLISGFDVGYVRTDVKVNSLAGNKISNGGQVGPYVSYVINPNFGVDGSFSYTGLSNNSNDNTVAPPLSSGYESNRYTGALNLNTYSSWNSINLSGTIGYLYSVELPASSAPSQVGGTPTLIHLATLKFNAIADYTVGNFDPYVPLTVNYDVSPTRDGTGRTGVTFGMGTKYNYTDQVVGSFQVTTEQLRSHSQNVVGEANLRITF